MTIVPRLCAVLHSGGGGYKDLKTRNHFSLDVGWHSQRINPSEEPSVGLLIPLQGCKKGLTDVVPIYIELFFFLHIWEGNNNPLCCITPLKVVGDVPAFRKVSARSVLWWVNHSSSFPSKSPLKALGWAEHTPVHPCAPKGRSDERVEAVALLKRIKHILRSPFSKHITREREGQLVVRSPILSTRWSLSQKNAEFKKSHRSNDLDSHSCTNVQLY